MVYKTRFPELGFTKTVKDWRFVDTSTGSVVGKQYHSKLELLADLTRYAKESWGLE